MSPFESLDDHTNFDFFMQSLGFTADICYGQQSPPIPDFIALPGFGAFSTSDQDGQSIPSGTAALSKIGDVDLTERAIGPKIVIPTERANLSKVVAPTERAIPTKLVIPIESTAATNTIKSAAGANATEREVVIEGETSRKKPVKERHHTLHSIVKSVTLSLVGAELRSVVHENKKHEKRRGVSIVLPRADSDEKVIRPNWNKTAAHRDNYLFIETLVAEICAAPEVQEGGWTRNMISTAAKGYFMWLRKLRRQAGRHGVDKENIDVIL